VAGQVVVQFDARNNVSPVLKKIRADSGQLEKALNGGTSALSKTKKGFSGAGVAAKGASKGLAVFGTAFKAALGPIGAALTAIGGLSAAFKTIAAQDFSIAKVESLGVNSEELVTRLKEVSNELNGQASVAELTGAAYDVASAGFTKAADAAEVLKAASLGATGGFSDINTVGNAATSVLNAYGIEASRATEIVDKFIQTQNDGKIVVAQYAANIGKVASAAAGLSIPLDEVNAVIAQSTASGVQADIAFTGLKGALARFASGEAAKALKDVGVNIDAATLANDGLLGTFKKLEAAGLDTGQIFKALGTEAGPALLPVLNNLEKFEELLENQKNSAGAAAKAQARAADTINGAYKRLSVAIQNVFSDQTALGTLIKTVFKVGAFAVEVLNEAMRNMQEAVAPLGEAFQEIFKDVDFQVVANIIKNVLVTSMSQVADALKIIVPLSIQVVKLLIDKLKNTTLGFVVSKAYELAKGMGIIKTKTEEATVASEKLKTNTGKIAPKIDAATEAKNRFIEATKSSLKFLTQEKAQIKTQQSAYENTVKITNARLNAEKAINSMHGQGLQVAYELAGSASERLKIAQDIFRNEMEGANIVYQQTLNSIEAERQRLEFRRQAAVIDARMIEAEGALAAAKAGSAEKAALILEKTKAAVDVQKQNVQMIDSQIRAQGQIAVHQKRAAEAQLQSARMTNEQNLKQKLVSKEINMSDKNAGKLVGKLGRSTTNAIMLKNELSNSNTNAQNLATGTGQVAHNAQQSAHMFIQVATQASNAANQINRAATAQRNLNAARAAQASSSSTTTTEGAAAGAYWKGGFKAFAKGGMVKGPTLGLIGEGGEPEYIIPQSKAAGFAANFLSGKRGTGAIPGFADGGVVAPSSASVNIQTGPVTQMGGQNYVTMQDMSQAVQAGVEQTLQFLMSDGTVRTGVGFD